MKNMVLIASTICCLAVSAPAATGGCPAPVKAAVNKAYPGATVNSCKQEKVKGVVQYEVKLTTKDAGKLELDVAPDGKLLQTEESIAVEALPQAVTDGLHSKYKGVVPVSAEKLVLADGSVRYEVAFQSGKTKKEVTLSADGKILEEE